MENQTILIVTQEKPELTPEMEEMLKGMSIRQQLWKVSPEVNVLVFKNFLKEHREDFKWITPVAALTLAIYIAKSGKVDLKGLEETVNEKLGIKLNPQGVKKFKANLGIATLAFAGAKIFEGFLSKDDKKKEKALSNISLKDLSFTDINNTINEYRKSKALQPKAEELLPISLAIIALFVISNPVEEVKALNWIKEQFFAIFGSVAYTLSETFDSAMLVLASKMKVDVTNDEDMEKFKKFVILAVMTAAVLITCGVCVVKDDSKKQNLNNFVKQLLEGMKKIAPAAFATIVAILVNKNIISEEELPEDIFGEFFEGEDEQVDVENEEENPLLEHDEVKNSNLTTESDSEG